jgi:type 1 glutamine amidotransferase
MLRYSPFLWLVGLLVLAGCSGVPTSADQPAPTEPAPTEPAPTEPAPTEPAPTEPAPTAAPRQAAAPFSVLVFSKTAGFRHDSIPAGIAAIEELGAEHDFTVQATEDATRFTDEGLAGYRVVVFLNTTGDVLDASQQAAFERFIRQGGGFVGVHAASDTEYDWPWYGGLVGTYFDSHPAIQPAILRVADETHLSTSALPAEWSRVDEWYNFRQPPGPEVTVLLRLDEDTYTGGNMGQDHPLSWYHPYDGGRSWYTGMGHTIESYSEPLFRAHLAGGILWAAGVDE